MYRHVPCKQGNVMLFAKYLLLGLLTAAVAGVHAEAPKKKAPEKEVSKKKGKSSAGRGSTAPTPAPNPENDADFRKFDLDGDGLVSKAEAAGNYDLIVFFDRSDRSKDGKLSRLEYDRLTKAVAARKAKTKTAAAK
jgi:hypothetical protein